MFQSTWNDPGDAASHIGWTRDGWDAVRRFSDGRTHPGFVDADEPARRVAGPAAVGGGHPTTWSEWSS